MPMHVEQSSTSAAYLFEQPLFGTERKELENEQQVPLLGITTRIKQVGQHRQGNIA